MKRRDRLADAIVSALADADSALYRSCGPAAELVASLAEEVAALRMSVQAYDRMVVGSRRPADTVTVEIKSDVEPLS